MGKQRDRHGLLHDGAHQEVVERYLGETGLRPESFAFYEVFGLFRLAGIAQQIDYRYFHKQTRNPAFKNFWILVNDFDWRCRAIIRRSGRP
jgi:aminoglycoside phosphotransferase (APT) family kinase protein